MKARSYRPAVRKEILAHCRPDRPGINPVGAVPDGPVVAATGAGAADSGPGPGTDASRGGTRPRYNGFVSLVYEGWQDRDAPHAVPDGVKFLRGYLGR